MSGPEAAHILAVHPPVASPALVPLPAADHRFTTLPRIPPLELYDANLDFYVEHLLVRDHLQQAMASVAVRDDRGDYHEAGPATRRQLTDLTTNASLWKTRIAAVDKILAVCRSAQFYDPQAGVQALEDLKALLRLVSLAYYPARIGWGTFDHPQGHDPDWLGSLAHDSLANPFAAFYCTRFAPKLAQSGICLLLMWIVSRDQLPALATLADYAQKTHPNLPVAAVGANDIVECCRSFVDTRLSICDEGLAERLQQLVRATAGRVAAWKDLGSAREISEIYLAPARITSVDLRPDHLPFGRLENLTTEIAGCHTVGGGRGAVIRMPDDAGQYLDRFVRLAPRQDGDCALGVRTELRDACRAADAGDLYQAGVRLIIWQAPQGSAEVLKTILWQYSRAGIWNHLVLPAQEKNHLTRALGLFAAANPNIVHSWDVARSPDPAAGSPPAWSARAVYSRVQKLPGRPLWQCVSDPGHLLLYLQKHGLQRVMRWRVPDGTGDVYTLGRRLTYHYQNPAHLPAGYLDEICLMVAEGGSVDMKRVRYNLERAFLVAYAVEKDVIVGNSSLKHPRPEYIETVNQQSGLDLTHYVERGYTSVRPEYRGMGIGARLLGGLTKRAGDRKVFSVISEDNEAARKMAIRNRTRQVAEYFSPRLGKRVGIWIPEWMLA